MSVYFGHIGRLRLVVFNCKPSNEQALRLKYSIKTCIGVLRKLVQETIEFFLVTNVKMLIFLKLLIVY